MKATKTLNMVIYDYTIDINDLYERFNKLYIEETGMGLSFDEFKKVQIKRVEGYYNETEFDCSLDYEKEVTEEEFVKK